jgi:hypothetical protein
MRIAAYPFASQHRRVAAVAHVTQIAMHHVERMRFGTWERVWSDSPNVQPL